MDQKVVLWGGDRLSQTRPIPRSPDSDNNAADQRKYDTEVKRGNKSTERHNKTKQLQMYGK